MLICSPKFLLVKLICVQEMWSLVTYLASHCWFLQHNSWLVFIPVWQWSWIVTILICINKWARVTYSFIHILTDQLYQVQAICQWRYICRNHESLTSWDLTREHMRRKREVRGGPWPPQYFCWGRGRICFGPPNNSNWSW